MDISNNTEIDTLMKQTTYTREECIEKLEKHNNDIYKCLKEYNGILEKKEDECHTSNQERYRLIRNLMDNTKS
jgi:hypothetical protein|tara:strand:+ start:118 stop:336 length:219 start_codon:yes stop_codon:yes gene_type:complete